MKPDLIHSNSYQFLKSIVASIFILLFTYTATSKVFEYSAFRAVLQPSPLIGHFAGFIAWTIPCIEIFIAGLLFYPRTMNVGLKASLTMMIIFSLYLGYMIAFIPELPCSCGGVLKLLTWPQHLLFNLALMLLAFCVSFPTIMHKLFIAINRRNRKPV
jgi:hypothetical protein